MSTVLGSRHPAESWVGITLAVPSLLIMPFLAWGKLRAAGHIGSKALRAEAKETFACAYLSFALLAGLAANATLGWWWADPAAAVISWCRGWRGRGLRPSVRNHARDGDVVFFLLEPRFERVTSLAAGRMELRTQSSRQIVDVASITRLEWRYVVTRGQSAWREAWGPADGDRRGHLSWSPTPASWGGRFLGGRGSRLGRLLGWTIWWAHWSGGRRRPCRRSLERGQTTYAEQRGRCGSCLSLSDSDASSGRPKT